MDKITPEIKELEISNFDYPLQDEKIAVYPLERRDRSKLLIYKKGAIAEDIYANVSTYLSPQSHVVFNNTKVVQARLNFRLSETRDIELFCLEPAHKTELNKALQKQKETEWKCFIGGAKKWKSGELISIVPGEHDTITLKAENVRKENDSYIIKFQWTPEQLSFADVLNAAGKVPLPPYIKRGTEEEDKDRYQTIYAVHEGSVAAPTAGLHFTPAVLESLQGKSISLDYLTFHVGAGTFKPVKVHNALDHEMHSEQILVEKYFIQNLLSKLSGDIVAVGTTSLRTLESLYWLGLKIHYKLFEPDGSLILNQFEYNELNPVLTSYEALQSILNYLDETGSDKLLARTQIMITPGYPWKIVNILATNFHQPKSTLILLVASFIGDKWKDIYEYALENNYRFLSYGDGSLLFRE